MAIGKVEGRVEDPGLGRDVPGRPGFARNLIAAADIADEDVKWRRWGIDGAAHDDGTPIASLDQANAYLSQHGNAHLILGLRHQDAVRMVALDRSPD